jgi:uncharacterized protein YigA (DUF484 family)
MGAVMGVNETGQVKARAEGESALEWDEVRDFLRTDPGLIRNDADLLTDLGLRIHAANVVDFVPPALARRALSQPPDFAMRRELEAIAKANYAAQAQAHAAVVELLEARNHADLARRLDEAARLRFNLAAGVIALERPGRTPAGWCVLDPGMTDSLLGPQGLARMGAPFDAETLFGEGAEGIQSVAMVRLAVWSPARQGVLAFGSKDAEGFTGDMGCELVALIARVIERTAERWPVL